MRSLTSRESIILTLCIVCALAYVGYAGIYNPYMNKKELLDEQLTKQKKLFKKNNQIIKEAKAVEGKYNRYYSQFKQTGTQEQVLSAMLSELENVANQKKMQIVELKPKTVRKIKFYNYYSVSLNINSSFEDVIHFLYQLQNEPYFYDVESIVFDKSMGAISKDVRTSLVLGKVYLP